MLYLKSSQLEDSQISARSDDEKGQGRIKKNRIGTLKWDSKLAEIAREHSLDMIERNFFRISVCFSDVLDALPYGKSVTIPSNSLENFDNS